MQTPFTLATPVLPLATAALIGAMLMADTAPARAQGEAIGGALIGGTAGAVIGAPRERRACHFRGNGEVAQVSRGNCTQGRQPAPHRNIDRPVPPRGSDQWEGAGFGRRPFRL